MNSIVLFEYFSENLENYKEDFKIYYEGFKSLITIFNTFLKNTVLTIFVQYSVYSIARHRLQTLQYEHGRS